MVFSRIIPISLMENHQLCIALGVILVSLLPCFDACGYKNCPVGKPNMLNVHILSHSHDDIGWLKTIDEYYYGDKSYIQRAGVQYILDSVITELEKDSNRRFIYVEIGFFWRWWEEQDSATKETVKKLINNGQFEFINGGWCMNDEASSHYSSIIDQMSFGFKFIQENFGSCARPLVGWQIDPFGHSKEQASLLAQMGMDGLFIGRLDWRDKNHRVEKKTLEMIWQASSSLGKPAWLFTGILPNTYSPPPGFCFDLLCSDEPIKDNPKLEGFNVNQRVDKFLNYTLKIAKWYETNNVVITMGNDFNYQHAGSWFKNLDKLIKYTNARQETGSLVNVFYSTPSCYLKAVHDSKPKLTYKYDDFFPYASDPHAYWTGYFTSRPTLKYFDRLSNNILQASKQISVLTNLQDHEAKLDVLRRAVANMQHHDAVTGTSKQAVAFDYAKLLSNGIKESEKLFSDALMIMSNEVVKSEFCTLLNISSCPITEKSSKFSVFVYNPFGHEVVHNMRIPILVESQNMPKFKIASANNDEYHYQIVELPESVRNIPGRESPVSHELIFATTVPPLGIQSFTIKRYNSSKQVQKSDQVRDEITKDYISLGYKHLNVKVNKKSGLIESVTSNGVEVSMSQYFAWYKGKKGNNTDFIYRASGAYIFRPDGSEPTPLTSATIEKVMQGELVSELHQTFNGWLSQIVRIYVNRPYVEFAWLVGPLPIDDKIGKEVIFKIDSDIRSGKTFYTDTNGREVLPRQRDDCPVPTCIQTEPVSSNYYPINSKIFIRDEERKVALTVLPDRAQGATSLKEGSLELMIHRRLLHDDAFGVEEALNETAFGKGLVVRGIHHLLVSPLDTATSEHRFQGLENYLPPVLSFSSEELEKHIDFKGINPKYIPLNIHILTLEFWNKNEVLLRLEHYYELKDDPVYSKPAKIDISKLFTTFQVVDAKEMILGGNELKSNVHRFTWNDESEDNINKGEDLVYTLYPMEIKTLLLKVRHNSSQ